ncbi:MAG: ABC transporter permease [Tissierellia bacterium]|nr:ABC transporter permease [Tissierellia bacterium]
MKALAYLLGRTSINSIKQLKNNPLKLIFYVLIIVGIGAALIFGNKGTGLGEQNLELFRAIFLGITLLLTFFSVKNGLDKGNNLFRLSDANFIFTAPIKPQLVLVYGFIKSIGTSLILIPLLLFQIPTLNMFFPIIQNGWIIIVGSFFLLTMINSTISLLVYSIGSLRENYNKFMKAFLYITVTIFVLGLVYNLAKTNDLVTGLINYMNLNIFRYIPIIGWITNIFEAAIVGFSNMTLIYLLLSLLTIFLGIFIMYNLNLDYYENAMDNSITKEEMYERAKSGKGNMDNLKSKVRKVQGEIKYRGAASFFSKQMLEARKKGFVFLDKQTLFVSIFSLIYAYFMRSNGVNFLLYMLSYMSLIFSQSNQWASELKNHYIYLIPESSVKKIIYATAIENIKSLITGLIIFVLASFIYQISIFQGIILAITYTSIIAIVLYSDLVIRRMLGGMVNVTASKVIRFLITIVFIIPGVILSGIWGMSFSGIAGIYGTYIIMIGYNMLASLILIYFSKGIFEKLELR